MSNRDIEVENLKFTVSRSELTERYHNALEILMEQWKVRNEIEGYNCEHEQRSRSEVALPTAKEIALLTKQLVIASGCDYPPED